MIFTEYSLYSFLLILAIVFVVGNRRYDLIDGFSIGNTTSWRFILAILIIMHHFACSYYYLDVCPWLKITPFYQLGGVLVGAFFMISGYGLTAKAITQGFVKARCGFLKKRLKRLFPLFIGLFIAALVFRKIFLGESIISELHKYPKYSQVLWYSWFIVAIVYCYISVYISLYLTKKKLNYLLHMLFFSCVYFYFVRHVFGLWFFWWNSIFAFNLGTFIAAYPTILSRMLRKYFRLFVMALFVIICSTYYLVIHTVGGGGCRSFS